VKCYVAFKTENELRTHLDIEHNKANAGAKDGAVKANALLGFQREAVQDEEAKNSKNPGLRDREEKIKIKDSEGIDFSYYFSYKYQSSIEFRKKKK
jgi:hypothetical protein